MLTGPHGGVSAVRIAVRITAAHSRGSVTRQAAFETAASIIPGTSCAVRPKVGITTSFS